MQNQHTTFEPLRVFLQDTDISYNLVKDISHDRSNNTVILTRVLHNKPLYYIHTFTTSFYRTIDPVVLFSLTSWSSLYDNKGPVQLLYPLELPIFIISCIYLVRKREKYRKTIKIFLGALFASIFISALFLPAVHPVKMIPLVIVLRVITGFGILSLLWENSQFKKLL